MERLLTTEDVAELLRIDPVTVRRLVTRGELAAYRIAGEYRFTPAGVENFVESQRVVINPGPNNQFDKFTEGARKVLSLAREEARQCNHNGIGTEHLLLALISEGEEIGARALLDVLQAQASEVRKRVEAAHPAGEQPIGDALIGLTPQGKECIELAVREARSADQHQIGTEHLLLGLLRKEEFLSTQVLHKSGVTLEAARERVKQLLKAEQPGDS